MVGTSNQSVPEMAIDNIKMASFVGLDYNSIQSMWPVALRSWVALSAFCVPVASSDWMMSLVSSFDHMYAAYNVYVYKVCI